MALESIYRGTVTGDKTGTPAKQAGLIINNNFQYLDHKIDGVLIQSTIINGVTTSSAVPTTGNIHAFGVGPGTYTNWGGLIVPANNIATLSRISGVYAMNLTPIDLSVKLNVSALSNNINSTSTTEALNLAGAKSLNDKIAQGITTWTAKSYLSGDQVNYLGKDWVSNAATVAGDVPGTSSKWYERIDIYTPIFSLGKNLIDKTQQNVGQAINTSGILIESAGWSNFKPIKVSGNTQYVFSGTISALNVRVRYEDANRNLISFAQATVMPFAFTTPSNCVFVILPAYLTTLTQANFAQLEVGAIATVYESYYKAIAPISVDLRDYQTKSISDSAYPKMTPVKNLIDKTNIVTGKLIHNITGLIVDNIDGCLFNSIEVSANTQYTFSGSISFVDQRVRYEDIYGNLISFTNATANPFTFTTPNNCAFVKLIAYFTNNLTNRTLFLNTAQLELGAVKTIYQDFFKKISIDKINIETLLSKEEANTNFVSLSYVGKNKLDKTAIIEGSAINGSGTIVVAANYSIIRIYCKPSTAYTFYGNLGGTSARYARVRFENSALGYISLFDPNATGIISTPFSFTTPSLCTSFVINTKCDSTSDYNTLQIEEGSSFTYYEPYFKGIDPNFIVLEKTGNWKDKKICFFGDSITANDKYTKIVSNSLEAIYVKNAVAGSCIATGKETIEPDGITRVALVTRANDIDIDSPNLIFIFAGTNDWYYNVPVGTITDTVTTTFFGALKAMIVALQSQNPTSRIVMSTMTMRSTNRTNYAAQRNYVDACLEVCKNYGVPCYDLFSKSGISYENIMNFTSDGVHPNTAGDELLSRQFISFINSI